MNGVDDAIAADGALLVGLRSSRRGSRDNSFPELVLSRGGRTIPLRLEELSSFVARYVPERTPRPGSYRVEGLGIDVRFEARTSAAPLAAPSVRALQQRQRAGRRGVREQVRLVFDAAPPAGAVAVVVDSERGGFGGAAVDAAAEGVSVYDWGGRCQRRPRGLRSPPSPGANVTVRWVDRDGQLGTPGTVHMSAG